jgi:hypothetical protein
MLLLMAQHSELANVRKHCEAQLSEMADPGFDVLDAVDIPDLLLRLANPDDFEAMVASPEDAYLAPVEMVGVSPTLGNLPNELQQEFCGIAKLLQRPYETFLLGARIRPLGLGLR